MNVNLTAFSIANFKAFGDSQRIGSCGARITVWGM